MALTSTVYNFEVALSNVDRGVYETLKLQLARHPSETLSYLLARLLAYCLEYEEGIAFSKGLSEAEDPAVWGHDLTGQLFLWVEVGAPAAQRLHKASKLGARVVVYAHKDPALLVSQLAREQIFAADKIKVYGFAPKFLEDVGNAVEKRSAVAISVSEGQLYLNVSGKDFETPLTEYSITAGKTT